MKFTMKLSNLSAIIMLCLSSNAVLAEASIQPVGSDIATSSINNVPVVNISKPNQDGVSHNQYSQFNVGSQGVVLNNAQSGTQSQLAGAINANQNLGGGAAKVILNEINSKDKTLLNGMIEVAGSKADVVVANRSGITCNGCGFINTGTGVLTTAALEFQDKKFKGYNVTGGTIEFEGKGMKKGDVDFTAVIARAEKINAAIQAKDLTVIAGKKNVAADLKTYTDLSNKEASPEVLVDVSQLGGMYAGKIVLVTNENGVGVNNPPTSLKNKGNIMADDLLVIIADNVSNDKTIASKNNLGLVVNTVTNNGSLDAGNENFIKTNVLTNHNSISSKNLTTISSNVSTNHGNINSKQGAVILNDNMLINHGSIQAAGKIAHKGNILINHGSMKSTNSSVFDNGMDIYYKPAIVTPPKNSWWSPRW